MAWFYARSGSPIGPVSEHYIRNTVAGCRRDAMTAPITPTATPGTKELRP